jgi:RecA/RadA recombinase
MNEFLGKILKTSGNEYASVVSEGVDGSDITGYIDTGCYMFNALLSGSIHGGVPDNKILAIAGESATGKTYFTLGICEEFLLNNTEGVVIYFDSEQAVTSEMINGRVMDSTRIAIMPVATVEEFRRQAIVITDEYLKTPQADRKPMLMVLDSLGMLSTEKEMADTAEGKSTRDMTRAQIVKSTFRVLTLKLGKAHIPLIMTNHTYAVVGSYFPTKEMGGGSGLKYAASTIIYLSKKKEKEGTDIIGNIIHCKTHKSRLTKENQEVDVRLRYDEGLSKHYGLLQMAEKCGAVKRVSNRFEFPDGKKVYEKAVLSDPTSYFTEEILTQIDEACKKEFRYGSS